MSPGILLTRCNQVLDTNPLRIRGSELQREQSQFQELASLCIRGPTPALSDNDLVIGGLFRVRNSTCQHHELQVRHGQSVYRTLA